MEEQTAKFMALACSVAGLVLLFFFSAALEQSSQPIAIGGMSVDNIGTGVKVCGIVESFKTSKGHMFFGLDDGTGVISAVVFNNTAQKINVSFADGDKLCVLGQLEEYPPGSDQLEVIVDKVVL